MHVEIQQKKCENCDFFNHDGDGWCYMFREIVIDCAQFRPNKPVQAMPKKRQA